MTDELRNELRKKLIARKLQQRRESSVNQVAAFGGGVNEALIDIAGFPVDVVNKGLSLIGLGSATPVGGSEQLKGLARSAGLVKDANVPETAGERAGRVVGASLPMFGAVGAIARTKATGGLLAPMVESFRQAPRANAAIEAVSAGGAAIGGEIGRNLGEEPELYKQIIGEIVGGIAAPSTVRIASHLPVIKIIDRVTRPLRPGAQKMIAGQMLEDVTGDRALALAKAREFNALPGTKFTLAEKINDQNLISLEQAVAKKVPGLQDDMLRNRAQTNKVIGDALKNFTGNVSGVDTKSATVQAFHSLKLRLKNAMNARMAGAVSRMQEQVRRLRAQGTRPEISRIINDELEDALGDARRQESAIWDQLDEGEQIVLRRAREAMEEWIGDQTPVPGFVRNFLESDDLVAAPFKDVKEFRTRLRRVQDAARSSGRPDIAFFLQRINNGIVDDISESALSDDFRIAVDFSTELNNRFTRGRIGQALKFDPRGGRKVSPETISETLFPASPVKASEGVTATMQAVSPMPGAAETGRTARTAAAIDDLVRTKLFNNVGEFDERAARTMLEKKGEFLRHFPRLREEIQAALRSSDAQNALANRISKAKVSLKDKNRTALGLITNSRPEQVIPKIMNSPQRRKLLSQAVSKTKRTDRFAYQGLQDGYVDELFSYGATGAVDELGNKQLSGLRLKEYLDATRQDIKAAGLFGDRELKRLDHIVENAMRLERTGTNEQKAAQLLEENTDFLSDFIIRVMGANIGGKFAGGSTGSPLVAAHAGSRVARMMAEAMPQESVVDLLANAIRDEKIYKELMGVVTTPALDTKRIQRLHSWLGALGIQLSEAVEETQQTEQQ